MRGWLGEMCEICGAMSCLLYRCRQLSAQMAGHRNPRRRRIRSLILPLLLILFLPLPALAASLSIALGPGGSTVALRTYGLGLVPIDGHFTRFQGRLDYDPLDHGRCVVTLRIDPASLTMASAAVGETVRGAGFLDTARYKTLAYHGACSTDGMSGKLTMHGVARLFVMAMDWQAASVTAVGRLQRADWGMTEHRLLGGSTVRITVTVPLPAADAADLR